jgi:hypothetical protein
MNPKNREEPSVPSAEFLADNLPPSESAEGAPDLIEVRVVGARLDCERLAILLENQGFLRTGFREDKAPSDGHWRAYLVRKTCAEDSKVQQP